MNATPLPRRHDIDALRIIAFGLLILYHCGMFYVAEWGWHVKSAYTSEWLQEPMRFLNQWRMSLLFVISGLAISFVWGRYSPGRLALRRIWRLLVPTVFGMAVVVAPQPYFEALNKGVIEPGFFDFWARYLSFQDFPGEAWGGENYIVWTWNHLWYLPYVLFYTLVAIPVIALLEGPARGLMTRIRSLRGPWLVLLPLVPLMLYGNFVWPLYEDISHSLVDDGYAHALYGTLFLYGYLIGRDEGLWAELLRLRYYLLGLGVLAYAALRAQSVWVGDEPGALVEQLSFLSVYLNRWVWILVMLAWGYALLNRPAAWVRYGTGAIFPWYVLHQTITVSAGYTLSQYALGPVAEPLLVLAATVVGCAVGYEFVIRRVPLLRPLFGLPVRTAPPADPRAAAPQH